MTKSAAAMLGQVWRCSLASGAWISQVVPSDWMVRPETRATESHLFQSLYTHAEHAAQTCAPCMFHTQATRDATTKPSYCATCAHMGSPCTRTPQTDPLPMPVMLVPSLTYTRLTHTRTQTHTLPKLLPVAKTAAHTCHTLGTSQCRQHQAVCQRGGGAQQARGCGARLRKGWPAGSGEEAHAGGAAARRHAAKGGGQA